MRVYFLINAGRGRRSPPDSLIQAFERILTNAGIDHHIALSRNIDEARELAGQAIASGYDTLWIGGGDGTINVLLNHTFAAGLVYGIVPMGTINALARSFGIPLSPLDAARKLVQGRIAELDVGMVNGSHFVCFASVGFDAAVVHDVTGALKRRCGQFAYVVKGVQAALGMKRLTPFTIEVPDGRGSSCCTGSDHSGTVPGSQQGYSFVLSNICNYAGFKMFHEVQPCSGQMEMFLFRRNRLFTMIGWAAASWLKNRALRGCFPTVGHYMLPEFTVRSEQPMFLQIDGEAVSLGDNLEYRFSCIEKGARILI